jgi:L-ribulose-5-phosphate 4-epimerase
MSFKYKSLKEECYEANMQLNALDLVVYTFGNVSAVDRANVYLPLNQVESITKT